MKNEERVSHHQKHKGVESLLKELEHHLNPVEKELISGFKYPQMPVIFIVGCARSGSTLLSQILANTKYFAYPSNFVSRFAYAPLLGAKLQRLLIEYDNKGEIFDANNFRNTTFSSELGKTFGATAPHEFWYFWKRFFHFGEIQQMTKEQLAAVDTVTFLKELAAFQSEFQRPLLMKAMIMNWHLPFLADLCKNFRFIFIKRNLADNAYSLLQARRSFFNDSLKWYSFKPPEYIDIKNRTPEKQVIQQVHFTNKAIESGLAKINNDAYTILNFEDLCDQPRNTLKKINEKWNFNIPLENNAQSFKRKHNKDSDISWNKIVQLAKEIK